MATWHPFTLISVVILALLPSITACQDRTGSKSAVVDTFQNAIVDWSNELIQATGEGAIASTEEESNRAKAYLKARGYAKMDAIANLYTAIEGTIISYSSVGKDYTADTEIRMNVEGYIRGVEVVEEKRVAEDGCTIVVITARVPLYGQRGLTTALGGVDALGPESRPVKVSKDISNKSSIPATATGPFTSLVVDCTGLNIQRAVCPKIRCVNGMELALKNQADYGPYALIENGLVAYVSSLESARDNRRSGKNPLVVKAIARSGDKFLCDPLVSDDDAVRILAENDKSHFVEKLSIILVVDIRPVSSAPQQRNFR